MITSIAARAAEEAARLRGARALHPAGRSYEATLRVTGTPDLPAPAGPLAEPGAHPAITRLSKGAGLPAGLPDALGIALRVPAGDAVVDLLFTTAGTLPGARHAPVPRASFLSGAYTTLLPYRVGGEVRMLGIFPHRHRDLPVRIDALDAAVTAEPAEFVLASASLTGAWRPFARLSVHTPLAADDPRATAFDPVLNDLPGLRLTGPLVTLRRRAYAASRRGRGAPAPHGGAVTGTAAGPAPSRPGR
ncbi:catalase family protein [Actinomadura macrotermitis]|uniref:Phosphodiesterase n=1 Tax=Actinomadura macrotermitis TaxID=2585200 RepID=A0A7K0BMX2_9ACTN|nr:phosphodiesterase [Actinomadura macrotermitis]MQY02222.1 hypothetical protein [Actinomadura macrotermitis]